MTPPGWVVGVAKVYWRRRLRGRMTFMFQKQKSSVLCHYDLDLSLTMGAGIIGLISQCSFTNYDCAQHRLLTDRYIPRQWWSMLLSLEIISVYSVHILPHSRIVRLMLGGQEWSMRIPSRTWVEGFLSWSKILPSFIHQQRLRAHHDIPDPKKS